MGVLNLAVIRAGADDPSFIRTVALIDAIYTGVLLAVGIAYFIYPPIVTIGFILLCFVVSLLMGARKDRSPNRAR